MDETRALGKHILVEFYGCSNEILRDVCRVKDGMLAATQDCGATLVDSTFHHFSPWGVSGVVVIQESHLTIHTWPEYHYAAVDLFTCGDSVDPWVAFKSLKQSLGADHSSVIVLNRGQVHVSQSSGIYLEQPDDQESQVISELNIKRQMWFRERDESNILSLKCKGDRLFKETSPYQTIEIFDSVKYGKMLVLDDRLICSEKDESIYHEMIVHVPMFTHPNVCDVLVIGGGDGGVVRELLKHPTLTTITLVEIDQVVVQSSREFLPHLSSGLDDPKVHLIIDDAADYIKCCQDQSYDLIIVDSSDPIGLSKGLFTQDFYEHIYRGLRSDGIMVAQSESPRFNEKTFREVYKCQQAIFGIEHVHCYLAFIPSYPTGMWSFAYCTKDDLDPTLNFDEQGINEMVSTQFLNYYNSAIHVAAFSLPNFVKQMLYEDVIREGKN